jgi:branched-chain amino acid transport system permease protein
MLTSTMIVGLVLGGGYALAALGLSLQYGIARMMNLAYGEMIILGAFLTMLMVTVLHLDPLLALLVLPILGYLAGWLLHWLMLGPLARRAGGDRGRLEIESILVTFGIMFILQGTMVWMFGTGISGYSYMETPIDLLGTKIATGKVLALGLAMLIGIAVYVLMRFTRFGTSMRAVGSSAQFAPFVGIDLDRYSRIAFGFGTALATATGVIVSMYQPFIATDGVTFTLKALIVVIMGGVGNLLGALVAGLMLGLIEAGVSAAIDPGLTLAASFLLFIVILLWRPQGLFGSGKRT